MAVNLGGHTFSKTKLKLFTKAKYFISVYNLPEERTSLCTRTIDCYEITFCFTDYWQTRYVCPPAGNATVRLRH